jgi:hypothetical protein
MTPGPGQPGVTGEGQPLAPGQNNPHRPPVQTPAGGNQQPKTPEQLLQELQQLHNPQQNSDQ